MRIHYRYGQPSSAWSYHSSPRQRFCLSPHFDSPSWCDPLPKPCSAPPHVNATFCCPAYWHHLVCRSHSLGSTRPVTLLMFLLLNRSLRRAHGSGARSSNGGTLFN